MVQRLAGDAVARVRRTERRREELRSRSRAQLLVELLTGTAERSSLVAERARARGLPVDGWHRVARLELAGAARATTSSRPRSAWTTSAASRRA